MSARIDRAKRLLDRIGATRTQRELYEPGMADMSDDLLDRLERRLDEAVAGAPAAIAAAKAVIAKHRAAQAVAPTDKRKQSLYFPEAMLADIQREATRLDRSLSWIVQRCVKLGLGDIRKLPSANAEDEEPQVKRAGSHR